MSKRQQPLFEDEQEQQIRDLIDPEQIINIDIDEIDVKSKDEALKLITDISRFYYDKKFMDEHPAFKKRIDADLESIRINLKMRKADEIAHDILLKNIGNNPGNASLYRSLSEMQRTILNITSKIEETVQRLNTMMKAYQTEINFDAVAPGENGDGEQPANPENVSNVHRGSKAFIEDMAKVDDSDIEIPPEE